ncbi:membrane protein [Halarchaeum grantii]|uniref:Membrane protein n=2 Tax=Halarchaeum grantii TaxID=1193105 RepID=A0A830FFQ6_9EURY|nr:membrane protein [Halarchaeum grantii]
MSDPDSTMTEESGDDARAGDATDAANRDVGKGLLDEEMGPSGAMAHLYRGEIHRMKYWRERLDETTNWAVIVMAAVLTWAFSSPDNPHYIVLIGIATLGVFLTVEARRYRGYDIWRSRVRTLQENVWAVGLDPETEVANPEWRERLGADYRTPTIKITAEEAIAHRLRRIYLPLFTVLLVAWLVRITAFSPESALDTAAVGVIPGTLVVAVVATFVLGALAVAFRPRTWHARGELLEERLRKEE